MLYRKIKIEIDTNNDELLETIWEHMKEIKGSGRGIAKWINLHIICHYFHLFLTFSM
jgi:hypothetical protein